MSEKRNHFLNDIIEEDLRTGKHGGRVATRFPPEPNGFLHIGHAKSICLNFGLAEQYGGTANLRFDDTNPAKEDTVYVESIQNDIRWLGFSWDGEVRFASDYFERMYGFAVELIEKGRAYVDSLTPEEMREYRGGFGEPGRPSPDRDRSVADNLDLFRRMREGEFPNGAYTLRAKIDMAHPNMVMRDPPLYRIRHDHHHRTGDAWCIYPMYDFAHCLEDSIEHITHSICTLEFENNREIYDWLLANVSAPYPSQQFEFARLALDYTVMSKRKLLLLVEEGHVTGWDDPRMPTLAGMRRRGVRPEAIRALCDLVGVAKNNSVVDIGKLEFCIRDDLNYEAPRVLAVLDPLEVVLTDVDEGATQELDADYWPRDIGKPGTRSVPLTRRLFIERADFADEAPSKWKRLASDQAVRLRHGPIIECAEVERDAAGEIVRLICRQAPDAKPKGAIHWVSAEHGVPAEIRLYDRLFAAPAPGSNEDVDFREELNENSLTVQRGVVEPSLAAAKGLERFQFERQGYFAVDPVDSAPGALVFNRIVTLRDSWAKKDQTGHTTVQRKAAKADAQPASEPRETEREASRAADPALAARFDRYQSELRLSANDADVLSGDRELGDFFESAVAAGEGVDAGGIARWVVNDVQRVRKDAPLGSLALKPAHVARLAALVGEDAITSSAAREVFDALVSDGGDPDRIIADRGLARVDDDAALDSLIAEVLAANPDELARYRGGNPQLFGFFMGALMRAGRGTLDPKTATPKLRAALG